MSQPDKFKRFREEVKKKDKKPLFSIENIVTIVLLIIAGGIWYLAFPIVIAQIKPTFSTAAGKDEFNDGILEIVMLDIGQGDAFLIKTPSGKFALIDSGEGKSKLGGYRANDAGNKVIIPYLEEHNITQLDWALMTHPDFDHGGGFVDVLQHIKVKEYIDPGVDDSSKFYQKVLELVREKNIKYRIAQAGDILQWDPDLSVQVLSAKHSADLGNNNSSVVLRIAYGEISAIFTGDLETEVEREIVAKYGSNLHSQILKVGHHGSKTASSIAFLKAVNPKIGLISVGADNRYGHPHNVVLRRLKRQHIKIYRTDFNGTVTLKTNGKKIDVSSVN